jgi:predicted ATP-binding protein involved in virulence
MFPYIKQIKVNDCYTYQDFKILDKESKNFKHIILTGKNGSGKTTILNRIYFLLNKFVKGEIIQKRVEDYKSVIKKQPKDTAVSVWENEIKKYSDVELTFFNSESFDHPKDFFYKEKGNYITSFFKAHRKVQLSEVTTVTKETAFEKKLNSTGNPDNFIAQFKQYLVNKKVYEAFEYMNNKKEAINQNKIFFDSFLNILRAIFNDKKLELEFVQENFEFYIIYGDGRRVTFNQLSEGFSAFLSVLMDLLMRTDLIRKENNNFKFEPKGIVLIDEPETHLHIEMQYEILPLISTVFPKIQFIVATHSPAIISSLEESIVFDVSSKSNVEDSVLGSSYSELMIKHFGLENEFGPQADKLIDELDNVYKEKDLKALIKLIEKYEAILTPSLRIEIESKIIELKSLGQND